MRKMRVPSMQGSGNQMVTSLINKPLGTAASNHAIPLGSGWRLFDGALHYRREKELCFVFFDILFVPSPINCFTRF